jgi:hypothetical protein
MTKVPLAQVNHINDIARGVFGTTKPLGLVLQHD